ncbi:MAG: hypothetical protein HYT79_04605 [Elusimicrobia bacterium]|nr:hypothetical protein [Elusimicrobiota bacterium]
MLSLTELKKCWIPHQGDYLSTEKGAIERLRRDVLALTKAGNSGLRGPPAIFNNEPHERH